MAPGAAMDKQVKMVCIPIASQRICQTVANILQINFVGSTHLTP